jgi:hypothetical protein
VANSSVAASFEELAADVAPGAAVGAAIARPDGAEPVALGRWSSGVAWSTIKVPLALAALRRDPARAEALVFTAITVSDNHASERLWSLLGSPGEAARRVQAVIEECGDAETMVESRRLRRGYTAFGQTQWPLGRQAGFAARLALLEDAAPVVSLMRELAPAQRWGLAAKGFAAKGGWGPGVRGDYLVRQFGVVPTPSGHVGVALAAQAHAFEGGVSALDAMTDWLVAHLPALTEQ